MSGHSKWATIHRQKGINDAKKGAAFTKVAAAIAIAVRQGGSGDPAQNFKLRLAIEKARAVNMPKNNIARAIERGLGAGDGVALNEMMFEGFTPGGVGVLVEAVSDNKLRTGQQVRDILDKSGGIFGSSGSVSYLFRQLGEVRIKNIGLTDDDELQLIDAGVNDIEKTDDEWLLYCDKDKSYELKDKLEQLKYTVTSVEMIMQPTTWIEVEDEEMQAKVEAILTKLENLDDVQKVWSNYA